MYWLYATLILKLISHLADTNLSIFGARQEFNMKDGAIRWQIWKLSVSLVKSCLAEGGGSHVRTSSGFSKLKGVHRLSLRFQSILISWKRRTSLFFFPFKNLPVSGNNIFIKTITNTNEKIGRDCYLDLKCYIGKQTYSNTLTHNLH